MISHGIIMGYAVSHETSHGWVVGGQGWGETGGGGRGEARFSISPQPPASISPCQASVRLPSGIRQACLVTFDLRQAKERFGWFVGGRGPGSNPVIELPALGMKRAPGLPTPVLPRAAG